MSTPITNTSQMTAAKLSSYKIQDDGGLAELSKAQRFGRRIADFCRSTMKPEGKFQIAARNHQVVMKIASLKSNETLGAQGANNEALHRSTNIAINALKAKVASAPNLSAETRRQVDACLTAKLREAVSPNTLHETARAKGVELLDKFLFSNITVNQNAEANNAVHVALTNAHREENPENILNIFARDTYPSGFLLKLLVI